MANYTVTRRTDGRVLWVLCATLLALGFALILGPGVIVMAVVVAWAAYLALHRTPGFTYGISTLAVVAAILLGAWAIF